MTASQPTPPDDLVLCAFRASHAMSAEVQRRLEHDGHDTRPSDRPVLSRLTTGPLSITALSNLLGISQQATSKAVTDLELRGYVERRPRPSDKRMRPIGLTDLGRELVRSDQHHRAMVATELGRRLGEGPGQVTRKFLAGVTTHFGQWATTPGRWLG